MTKIQFLKPSYNSDKSVAICELDKTQAPFCGIDSSSDAKTYSLINLRSSRKLRGIQKNGISVQNKKYSQQKFTDLFCKICSQAKLRGSPSNVWKS